MKLNQTLHNEKGSALFEILAAMAMLAFVIAGMMITISYARYKSIVNYHERKIAFLAESELNKLNMRVSVNQFLPQGIASVNYRIEDPRHGKPIIATIYFTRSYHADIAAGLDVFYTTYTAEARWKEHASLTSYPRLVAPMRYLTLRADYYVKKTGP